MNYDFLTLEDYNSLLANYGRFFYDEYVIDISNLNLTDGNTVSIDDWIMVSKTNNSISVNCINNLLTGAYSITDADEDTIFTRGNFKTVLSNVGDNCKIILQMANNLTFNINNDLLQISPLEQFAVYPIKQELHFTVKNKEGELVDGTVTFDSESRKFTNGDCTVTIDAKNREYVLLSFNVNNNITVVPICCIGSTSSTISIDEEYNTFWIMENCKIGFRHQPIDNPTYKLTKMDGTVLATQTGGEDSDFVLFTLNTVNWSEGYLPVKVYVNNSFYEVTVPVKMKEGSMLDFLENPEGIYKFKITEDIPIIKENRYSPKNLVNFYTQYSNLSNIPSIKMLIYGKYMFNDFTFKGSEMSGEGFIIINKMPGNPGYMVKFHNCVFEDIYITGKLFSQYIAFYDCTFKNLKGNIVEGNTYFIRCEFIETEPSYTEIVSNADRVTFDNCTFKLEYEVNEPYMPFHMLHVLPGALVNYEQVTSDYFPIGNNKINIDITFSDKKLLSNNGMIYCIGDTICYYNVQVIDL